MKAYRPAILALVIVTTLAALVNFTAPPRAQRSEPEAKAETVPDWFRPGHTRNEGRGLEVYMPNVIRSQDKGADVEWFKVRDTKADGVKTVAVFIVPSYDSSGWAIYADHTAARLSSADLSRTLANWNAGPGDYTSLVREATNARLEAADGPSSPER